MARLNIDDELYRAYGEEAARQKVSAGEFITQALRDWLTEFQEDVQIAEERLTAYERTGDAVDVENVLRERGLKY